jgi:hypothetical protein
MNRIVSPLLGIILCLISFFALPFYSYGAGSVRPEIVGWVEDACIQPYKLILPAKVDTGAVTCSLNASDMTQFEKNGEKWVRLTIIDKNGKRAVIEKKIIGMRRIKRHYGHYQDRPVIRLIICVGNILKTSEVNLVDRTGFVYPLLIGRNFMGGSMIVNPSATYTIEPECTNN